MKCPSCGDNTPDNWTRLMVRGGSGVVRPTYELEVSGPDESRGRDTSRTPVAWVFFDYMECANYECGELVVRMHEARPTGFERADNAIDVQTQIWTVRPRFSTRRVENEVPEPFRSDYLEAAALLEISPRMSAVLSRRLLYDLLQRYAGIAEYTLKGSIDKFISDTTHPTRVRENLHLLREMGDFGAHTQTTNDQAQIVNVERDEAEWTLSVIDRLFDYFIVSPAKDAALHDAWADKLDKTGRKAIPPLPDEGDES